MEISIVIPTRNNGNRISSTLGFLFNQTIAPNSYEIVVVDNGSTDNTEVVLSQLQSEYKNIRWVKELQPGRTFARNRGIRESNGKVILFLDDDIEVDANHLESHLVYHSKSSVPVAVIGRVIDVSPITPAFVEDYFHARQTAGSSVSNRDTDCIYEGLHFATGNVSLLRSTLETVKTSSRLEEEFYFDPSFNFREDADMGCRLIKNGIRFIFADEIVCRHNHPRSWLLIVDRSYSAGYALVQLNEKHPETKMAGQQYVTASASINYGLLLACILLFGPALLVSPVWPRFLRKIVGALLAYHTNRGFQQALTDQRKNSE